MANIDLYILCLNVFGRLVNTIMGKLRIPGHASEQFSIALSFIFEVGLSRLIDSSSQSIQNSWIDSLKWYTIFTSSMTLLPENANKLIFIKHHQQYYNITVTGWCIMMYSMFLFIVILFIVILLNKSFKWHSELQILVVLVWTSG